MIELYHKMQCPFSAKVRDYIDSHGLKEKIKFHDTESESGAKEKLQQLTQKTQVPCLVVDGKPVLESNEIINWMEKNLH